MIAKDEAPVLRRCLEAARGAVDEIVLVDTGSRDETPQIAAEMGAKVFHHPWQDDFSEARNHSLDHATGDWALWLDADELLQPGGAEAIRAAVKDARAAGYYLRFTDMLDDGKATHYLMPRLFLLRPEIRFVNVFHEQILASVERYARAHGLGVGTCDAKVLHYGYGESEMRRKGKVERMNRLFRKQLERHPNDAYSWYKFGDFARQSDHAEGVRALQRCLDLIRESVRAGDSCPVFTPEALALLATEQQHLGRSAEASAALAELEKLGIGPTPNFLFAKACVARAQGDHRTALDFFERCLATEPSALPVSVQWGVQGPLSWYGIAECKASLGDGDGAIAAFREALRLAPRHAEIALSHATFLLRRGNAVECLEALTNYLASDPPRSELWTKYGEPLMSLALRVVEQRALALGAPEKSPT